MIRVTIRQEAERRGIENPNQLAVDLDIAPSKAARLWQGEKLPELKTLDHICAAWGCGLDALIHCAPDTAQKPKRKKP